MYISPSFQGKLISVTYTLKVYVKHEAWNNFGEGKFIVLPIKLCSAPNQPIEANIQEQQPSDEIVEGIPVEADNDYNQQALIPNERMFAAASKPSIVNA